MMKNKVHPPIFITGVERSGSSMIAKIVGLGGAFIGKSSVMFENKKIRQLVDGYYVGLNIDPNLQYPLPEFPIPQPILWKEKVVGCLKDEVGFCEHYPWAYKSPKLCQTWPIWHEAFPDAKWIIVRRRTADIVNSCVKTSFMKSFKDPALLQKVGVETEREGWLWWVRQHEEMFTGLEAAGASCMTVWPDRMVHGDYGQVNEMLMWTGLHWNPTIVDKISPMLWKSRTFKK